MPLEIAENTDFWWTIVPSGVPGDGSGYNKHFITGGMGGYKRTGDQGIIDPFFYRMMLGLLGNLHTWG